MLSDFARIYINASVPVLRERCVAITHLFNRNLFKTYPELKRAFNMECKASSTPQQALAAIVFAYAANIDRADRFRPVMLRLVGKAVACGITAADYPIIGSHLLDAIKETLGYAATTHLLAAWAEAFALFTETLVIEEGKLNSVSRVNIAEMEDANAI